MLLSPRKEARRITLPEPDPMQPQPDRPHMPGYGLPESAPDVEKLPWSRAVESLIKAHNYWVASTRPDGRPHSMPVWGLWLDGAFMFSTGRSSVKGRNLVANPYVVVHLESGDDVVVLQGVVEEVKDAALLAR